MRKVIVMDEAWPLAGMVEAYRDAYLADYAPGARRRGMTLEAVLLSPPLILAEGGNRITFVWSLADSAAFWPMRFTEDDGKRAWWERGATMTLRQERSFHVGFEGADRDAR